MGGKGMTLKEATEMEIEVWRYLAAHPEIADKNCLPEELWGKIKNMPTKCPVCEYVKGNCKTCPLALDKTEWICISKNHPCSAWLNAKTDEERIENATAIVKLLEAALEKEKRNEKSN
jgi:hypothetical protein